MCEEPPEDVEESIKKVGFKLDPVEGQCVRCNEEGLVIQVTALVYYNGRDKFGVPCTVESKWSVQYCEWCLNHMLHPDVPDDVDTMYV